MNSIITIDASTVPEDPGARRAISRPRPPGESPRLTFGGVLRSERIKLASLRSIRLTILVTVIGGLGISTAIAAVMKSLMTDQVRNQMLGSAESGDQLYLLLVGTAAAYFFALVFGVLGVFVIGSEYSSGMVRSTLTAVPKRTPVFVAKSLVLSAVTAVTALVIIGGGLVIALIFKPDAAAQLGSLEVISGALGTVVYLVIIALFAYGVAGLLRSTAGGIATIAAVMFVVPIVVQALTLTGWEWVPKVAAALPTALGSVLNAGIIESPVGTSFLGASVALLLWAAVVVIPAGFAFKRRDAK